MRAVRVVSGCCVFGRRHQRYTATLVTDLAMYIVRLDLLAEVAGRHAQAWDFFTTALQFKQLKRAHAHAATNSQALAPTL